MRTTYHLAVLALLGVLTLGGLGAQWSLTRLGAQTASPGLAGRAGAPNGPTGLVSAAAAPAEQQTIVAASGAREAPPKPPPVRWVQNFRATDLFAGPEPGAPSLGQAAQFSTYRLVESEGGRAKLFDPGRGVGRPPGHVWANPEDFGPAGAPEPEFALATGVSIDPRTRRQLPERVGDGWPRIPSAELAVVVDGDSGGILYGKNAHGQVAPASLTKILTALVALEQGHPQEKVRVDVDSKVLARSTDSTVMGLMPGDVVSLETLLYGLMLPSGNDAALAIARHIGGSDARFVEMMNEKVDALGLENSQFRNPHGLDDDGHWSSPYDLAQMARDGMQHPLFYNLSASRVWEAEGFSLWNLNRLLGQYPGADGVKVGYTDAAGRCIVSSATRNGHRVFVTLIKSNDPVGESRMLLDYAFQNFKW